MNNYRVARRILLISIIAVGLGVFNATLDLVNDMTVGIPLFLDTIGTLVSTAVFGVFAGVTTAVVTHAVMELYNGFPGTYAPWVIVNIFSALTLWVVIRRGLFVSFADVIRATLLITVINALIGGLIAAFLFSGNTEHAVDYIATSLRVFGQNIFTTNFLARLPVNIIDKALAVGIAWAARLLFLGSRRSNDDEGFAGQSTLRG